MLVIQYVSEAFHGPLSNQAFNHFEIMDHMIGVFLIQVMLTLGHTLGTLLTSLLKECICI